MKVAITGGTGSLGRALVKHYLTGPVRAERCVVLSRDEVKQGDLEAEFPQSSALRLFLGDVRDEARLVQAFWHCDTVIHTAALKRISSFYSAGEILKTNTGGTVNVIAAAVEAGVKRVLLISSDKAVTPTNFYGVSKAAAEGYAVQANTFTAPRGTRVSVLRYGNVMGSRGSVLELWRRQWLAKQPLTVTDARMTRFLLSLPQAVRLVTSVLQSMEGGEIFVPVLPAAYMTTVAAAVFPQWPHEVTGPRPGGEKLHESLLSDEERTRLALVNAEGLGLIGLGGLLAVLPSFSPWRSGPWGFPPTTFSPYTSDRCANMTAEDIRGWLDREIPGWRGGQWS